METLSIIGLRLSPWIVGASHRRMGAHRLRGHIRTPQKNSVGPGIARERRHDDGNGNTPAPHDGKES